MNLHEYLDILCGQIRCKKARPMIAAEIKNHVEDQAEAYRAAGMDEETAMRSAVKEMGDPVKAGVELDRVHRPRMQWRLIAAAALLSLIGLIVQIIIFRAGCMSDEASGQTLRNQYIVHAAVYTLVGLAIMLGVCFADYTLLGRHPAALWLGLCGMQLLCACSDRILTLPGMYNGSYRGRYYIAALMAPAFAALVFHFRNNRLSGLLKCGLLCMPAVFCMGRSVSAGIELALVILLILTAAVLKGWFGERKLRALSLLYGVAVGVPALLLGAVLAFHDKLTLLKEYQVMRLKNILGMLPAEDGGVSYLTMAVKSELAGVTLFGGGELPYSYAILPGVQSDYVITSMLTYFGVAFTTAVLLLVFYFIAGGFRISLRQKNQLGSMVSIACIGMLTVKSLLYLMSNLGLTMILGQMSMPFLSYGLGNTIVSALLTGLLLSTYRNTNIVWESHIRPGYRFRVPVEKIG